MNTLGDQENAIMNTNTSMTSTNSHNAESLAPMAGYAAMIGGTVGLFLLVRMYGERMSPFAAETAGAAAGKAPAGVAAHPMMHVLLALLAIILLGRWLGKSFATSASRASSARWSPASCSARRCSGRIWPDGDALHPAARRRRRTWASSPRLGVILYMFLVGLELNAGLLRSHAHATVAISHASIVAPFLLGAMLALWLYPAARAGGRAVHELRAVHGRGDVDHRVSRCSPASSPIGRWTRPTLGVVALSCAAIDDVTAWCLLAFVVGVAQAEVGGAVQTIVLALGYIAFMLVVVRPLAMRYFGHDASKHPQRRMAVWVLVALLLSALTAEWIGIHAIFGAFLLGAIIPHDSDVARDFQHKLEDIVKILLLPAFFAFTGMRTEIGLVSRLAGLG